MSTAYVLNGYGCYETKDNERGITLRYAGVNFWFPYDKVTAIPDWTFREVDHNKSASDGESESVLTYFTHTVNGKRVAEELLMTQIPDRNVDMGFKIYSEKETKDRRTQKSTNIPCGVDIDGHTLEAEVREVFPTHADWAEVHKMAEEFKMRKIQDYFDSKRQRMTGGPGQLHPTGILKTYMQELGIKDLDDVGKFQDKNEDYLAAMEKLIDRFGKYAFEAGRGRTNRLEAEDPAPTPEPATK